MRDTLNVWLSEKNEERSTIVVIIGDEKSEEQLLMGSTKREQ
jgi:hypothetical protein